MRASAIQFTPSGLIVATNVQAALQELDSEKAVAANAVMDGDAAGGDLAGTYPNPTVVEANVDHAGLANLAAGDPHTQYALETNLNATVDSETADTTVSNTSAATDLARLTIPSGHPTVGSLYQFRAWGNLLNNTGSNQIPLLLFIFGSTTVLQDPGFSVAASADRRAWVFEALIAVNALSGANNLDFFAELRASNAAATGELETPSTAIPSLGQAVGTQDVTATAKDVAVQIDFPTASTNLEMVCRAASLDVIRP